MGLRFILVGLVAGLGLTLPSLDRISSFGRSAHTWANARMAEWDASMPSDEGTFVVVSEASPVEVESTDTVEATPAVTDPTTATTTLPNPEAPAATADAAPASNLPTSTQTVTEYLPIDSTELTGGLSLPTEPMVLDQSPAPVAMAAVEVLTATQPPIDLDRAFEAAQERTLADFGRDLTAIAAAAREAAALASAQESAAREAAKLKANQEAAIAAATREAAAITAATCETGTGFEPIEIGENLYCGMAYHLNRGAEGLDTKAGPVSSPAPVVVETPRTGPAFEPIEVADDLYSGVAFALNREAEGQPSPVVEVATGKTEPREPVAVRKPIFQAISLTREAVSAWAKVLHGPALVVIPH